MKILFLQKRPLFPLDTGGKIRTWNVLRHLAQWHDVTYLCNVEAGEDTAVAQMEALGLRVETIPWRETQRGSWRFYCELAANLFSSLPFNAAKDFDSKLRQRATQLLRRESYDLLICDFVQMAGNAMGLPGPPKVLFQHNVEAEIFERHSERDAAWLRRKFMTYQAAKMRRFEGNAGRFFDGVIAVSERDCRQFETRYGWDHCYAIDTAVDVEHFRPRDDSIDPHLVSFVGSMDWLPNVDAVEFLTREIWPLVRAAHPQARLQIVGRRPDAAVRRHHGQQGIEVTGDVPDVRPYYARCSIVVVPMRIGGGTRIKIYEAMAMGKPVVSTRLGAEGLSYTEGVHIEIADHADEFANSLIGLLNESNRRQNMGQAARTHVCERFSTEVIARQFEDICLACARLDRFSAETTVAVSTECASPVGGGPHD